MKRQKILLGIVLSLVLCLATASVLAAGFGVIYRTESLNLREQGSSTSRWLGSYNKGTWVEISGSQNNFYRVRTPDGRMGYMSKNYINTGDGNAWTAVVRNQNGGAFLNFRAQPSYNARVLGIFYNGVPLLVNSYENGWYGVSINGEYGYVRSEFVVEQGRSRPGSSDVYTIKTPNNSAMNLRNGPGLSYGVVRQFPGDSYVMVLAKGNSWSRVAIDGYVGFMSNDYLREGLCAARDIAAAEQGGSSGGVGRAYAVVSNPRSTQALNLREHASVGARVLDKLYNGNRLWLDDQGTEWCAVTDQATGLSGYVMTQFVRLYNAPSTPTRYVFHPNGTYVNLRSSPDMGYGSVITRIPSGNYVTVVTPGPDWCEVRYNGMTGYMMTYFLQ